MMRRNSSIRIARYILLVLFAAICVIACTEDDATAPLKITGITPSTARTGDTIQIDGVGFIQRPSQNTVLFTQAGVNEQTVSARVVETGEDYIKVLVPAGIATGKVVVEVRGTEQLLDFTYDPAERPFIPQLSSVSPAQSRPGSEVYIELQIPRTLRASDQVEVWFNDEPATASPMSGDRLIRAKVPQLAEGSATISVKVNAIAASNTLPFTIEAIPALTVKAFWCAMDGGFNQQLYAGKLDAGMLDVNVFRENQTGWSAGMILDEVNDYVYWANSDGIMRAKRDASGDIETIYNIYSVYDVAFDVPSHQLYLPGYDANNGIYRLDPETRQLTLLYDLNYISGSIPSIKITATHVYWTEPELKRVMVAPLNGSGEPTVLLETDGSPLNVAIDETNNKLYVVETTDLPDGTSEFSILETSLDGSGTIEEFFAAPGYVTDLEIKDGYLYWLYSISEGFMERKAIEGSGSPEVVFTNINGGLYFCLEN